MNNKNRPERIHQFIISGITFLAGFFLTWFGYQKTLPFWEQANQIFPISPDTYSTYLFITGLALLIAGFVGLLREKVV